ncbi:hypothetical protein FB561_0762 [Kribbella amoyensis]|uniref:Abi-like protein n=1 Tax=Kribbella amoyensis TaxID=996641 RepID=A0A561BLI8_9ACTN|nr:hypothetical protein [Kribbella amoyensis]TWD79698.1 hypothetical protein FB561_0762 [Kribbella amoyensis]
MPRSPWTLEDLLSRARLAPYLTTCSGRIPDALILYGWNSEVSGAFFESLHYLEVGLRNAMDRQLTGWAASCGARKAWYVDEVVPLSPPTRAKIAVARHNATRDDRAEVPGKVVAELPFGFWWSLLGDEYNRRLWQPCLRYAFDGPVRRLRLHSELNGLRLLRNRIAHHEPIQAATSAWPTNDWWTWRTGSRRSCAPGSN